MDTKGIVHIKSILKDNKIDVSLLKKGMYILKSKNSISKFVKE